MKLAEYKNIIFATVAVVYMVVILSFVARVEKHEICEGIDLEISTDAQNYFIDKNDVLEIIEDKVGVVLGQPFSHISVKKIEESLETHSSIRNAEVYKTPGKTIAIRVEQRRPILRVVDKASTSYYIDDEGFVMAISKKFTARVPVANGEISLNWEKFRNHVIDTAMLKTPSEKLLGAMYQFAKFVDSDDFWKKQVQQLYVNELGEVEMVPRVGAQIVLLGDLENFPEKLSKLNALYSQIFATRGWNQYRVIDLRFSNQIVCKRR